MNPKPLPEMGFLVIGAKKAGTTSLFEYLRQHPSIYLPRAKEIPYFSLQDPVTQYPGGWRQYMAERFAGAPSTSVCGTVTSTYMAGSVIYVHHRDRLLCAPTAERIVPERIRETCPGVRLLAILRDPVPRAESQHKMLVLGREEQRPFDEAVAELLHGDALEEARRFPTDTNSYVTNGEYARILSPYYDVFPREQILVVFTEDLERDPGAILRTALRHIGVDETFVPPNLGVRYMEGATSRRIDWLDLWGWQRAAIRKGVARAVWHALPSGGRRRLSHAYDAAAFREFAWNRVRPSQSVSTTRTETRAALRSHYLQDTEQLEELIKRRVPWH